MTKKFRSFRYYYLLACACKDMNHRRRRVQSGKYKECNIYCQLCDIKQIIWLFAGCTYSIRGREQKIFNRTKHMKYLSIHTVNRLESKMWRTRNKSIGTIIDSNYYERIIVCPSIRRMEMLIILHPKTFFSSSLSLIFSRVPRSQFQFKILFRRACRMKILKTIFFTSLISALL